MDETASVGTTAEPGRRNFQAQNTEHPPVHICLTHPHARHTACHAGKMGDNEKLTLKSEDSYIAFRMDAMK